MRDSDERADKERKQSEEERRKSKDIPGQVFIGVVDCSSLPSSSDDDDDGVSMMFDRSALVLDAVPGGSLDLKILYPALVGFGNSTGRGRRAALAKYGEKLDFCTRGTACCSLRVQSRTIGRSARGSTYVALGTAENEFASLTAY